MSVDHPPPTDDGHDHTDEVPRSGIAGLVDRFRHAMPHDHDSAETTGALIDTGAQGIRATKVSLVGLGITAALQAVIVAFTGSVALLSDTLHNLTDALTAVPLWVAFSLGRRKPTPRFTYGYHRAEDLAGIVIVVAIAVSAGAVAWESIQRFFEPRQLDHVGWVIAAGIIGALGNEAVARYRITVGRRIGSEALVADGYHARTDAYTSLSVVAAGIGSMLGWSWADPLGGLIVAVMILVLLRTTAVRMFGRLLDAVDPDLVANARQIALDVDGVEDVPIMRIRWSGHRLLASISVAVDPTITVETGHEIGQTVAHTLAHDFPYVMDAVVHVDPHGVETSHDLTGHHRPTGP